MLTDTVNNRIPRAKNWNKMDTQRATMAGLATTILPPVDIRTCVNKLIGLLHSVWNPFFTENTTNSLLQTRSEHRREYNSGLQGNLGLFIDSLLHSQLLPSEEQDFKIGISLLKSLEFENLLKSGLTHPFDGLPIPSSKQLHSPNCDLIFSPKKENSVFLQRNNLQCSIVASKLNMEKVLCQDLVPKGMHQSEVNVKNLQDKALCLHQPLNSGIQDCAVNIQMMIQVLPESTPTITEVTNNHINTLNRELIIRKSKQMSKSSKNRRRRQKRKNKEIEQSTTRSPPCSPLNCISQGDSNLDDIIFEELVITEMPVDNSVDSDDESFCIEFIGDENACVTSSLDYSFCESVSSDDFSVDFCDGDDKLGMPRSARKIISESVSSDDFSVDFCDGDDKLGMPRSARKIISESVSSDDFSVDFCDKEEEIGTPKSVNRSFSDSISSDDFCIEFCSEGDELDGCIIGTTFTEQGFSSESEDDSDVNCSYDDDDGEFKELSFSIGACFMSSLTSTCVAIANSSIVGGFCFDNLTEMSPELRAVNERWQKEILDVPSHSTSSKSSTKKVSFAPDEGLVSIFSVEAYERKGEWETYALERFRFKRRIEAVEKIISPCLSKTHRDKVLLRLQVNSV